MFSTWLALMTSLFVHVHRAPYVSRLRPSSICSRTSMCSTLLSCSVTVDAISSAVASVRRSRSVPPSAWMACKRPHSVSGRPVCDSTASTEAGRPAAASSRRASSALAAASERSCATSAPIAVWNSTPAAVTSGRTSVMNGSSAPTSSPVGGAHASGLAICAACGCASSCGCFTTSYAPMLLSSRADAASLRTACCSATAVSVGMGAPAGRTVSATPSARSASAR
mmetsp:Transcript_22434/g.78628  ORF Transcript_22434/g.78628 Transcript_22434/m.78628 type:complete len:225 (-) Transcript_22434:1007-1681(-)